MSKEEMKKRGWDVLDVLLVTGDSYVDHPSYGCAVIGRVLEAAGYRVGVIAQPDWRSVEPFTRLGRPRLFVGITAGNLDSMVSNYTSHKKPRLTRRLFSARHTRSPPRQGHNRLRQRGHARRLAAFPSS